MGLSAPRWWPTWALVGALAVVGRLPCRVRLVLGCALGDALRRVLRRLLLVAWIGSHSATDLAQDMGVDYTNDTVALAEGYLSRFG